MFEINDEKYLKRQIGNNQVILFLGAGFSRDAVNKNGTKFPSAWGFGKELWKFLGYPGDYDNTPLPQMYQAFLDASIKLPKKKEFMERMLLSSSIPDYYDLICEPFWFKIYTINIDDVVSEIYKRNTIPIEELKYPNDEYSERDQSLEKTQIIYLHGKLPSDPSEVVFSTQQYAKAQLARQPLYGQFVYDYATMPVIFIGTELDEPLFDRYIEAREGRFGFRELRPKSFLITPSLSPVKVDNLKNNYNVYHVSGTTETFFSWIESIEDELPEKKEVLKRTFPSLLNALSYVDLDGVSKESIVEFSKSFNRVPRELKIRNERSGFLEGTSPRWNDIVKELDIPRSITKSIVNCVCEPIESKDQNQKVTLFTLTGYAGSGKSTLLKRLGLTLSQNGHTVFLSYSDFIPKIKDIIKVIDSINDRVVLMFDNGENAVSILPALIEELNRALNFTPVIILSIRTNFYSRIKHIISSETVDHQQFQIPNLDDQEIDFLIQKLDDNNLLGILKGKSDHERRREFKVRAHRQILIAMKEATNGKSFGTIISDEYNSIEPLEAKILCACIALSTEHGFTNSKQDLVGFSKVSHIEALNYLETVLQGTIMWVGDGRRFMLRHKILADFMIKNCISRDILKEAYIRVLSVLAPELNMQSNSRSRKFNLFKALINHKTLYRRFKNNIEQAREVYDSIAEYFANDAHFWLQYGSLEVQGIGGDLSLGENYLNQAESLNPNSDYVRNAKCNLLYKQALFASNRKEAFEIYDIANQKAQAQLLAIGKEDSYIYRIYCGGRYQFIRKWIKNKDKKKSELDELKSAIKNAITFHPFNDKLKVTYNAIQRAYIQLGIKAELEDPDIPDFAK